MSFLHGVRRVHCLGIGGIGISALAKFCQAKGIKVSGTDLKSTLVTKGLEKLGIEVFVGEASTSHFPVAVDLVIYSEAIPETHPERALAAARGITQLGHFDFLGELSKEYRTISITGTNGKSTTTAMVGRIFEEAGLDPTVFVGSLVPGWKLGNLRIGRSEFLIIEGDEYKQKMVKLQPETIAITNVEADHLDVYRDLEHIIETFAEAAEKTRAHVLVNAMDKNSRAVVGRLSDRVRRHLAWFGSDDDGAVADYMASGRVVEAGKQSFKFVVSGTEVCSVPLLVLGAFNAMNALVAASVARLYDIAPDVIARSLGSFTGIWRRFERVGEFHGATIISDYAHHPTAIKGTIAAAKEFFPHQRLILLFEPHQHSRTKELFTDFVAAFDGVDALILSEIYGVVGRTEKADRVSSQDLLAEVIKRDTAPVKAYFTKTLKEAEGRLRDIAEEGDVVLVMGAGNVDEVARSLARTK